MSDLNKLFNKYFCDKGGMKHNYHEVYEPYFEPRREDPINFLEIGTFKAASTRAFYDYFPNATIYTMDIFTRTNPHDIDILEEDRVRWLKTDSTVSSLPQKMRKEWGDVKFDFVIDDGAHWPKANRLTFENIIEFLKDDGVYFIEDVFPMHKMTRAELGNNWLRQRPELYDMLEHNSFLNSIEKYNVKPYDFRKRSKNPDSFIFAISK